jgi:hypothetical protein
MLGDSTRKLRARPAGHQHEPVGEWRAGPVGAWVGGSLNIDILQPSTRIAGEPHVGPTKRTFADDYLRTGD